MRWAMLTVLVFSLVCSVLSTESDEEPSLQIKTRSSVYNVGENKAIHCEGHNVPERIDWISPSNHAVEGKSNKNTRIYVERKESEPNLVALIIHSAKVIDTGNWTCKSGDLSKVIGIVVGVKVKMPVKFEKVEEDEGNSAKLICKADGDPQPSVQWYMDRIPIDEEPEKYVMSRTRDNTYVLDIKHLTHADAGEYKYMCRVTQKALSHYVTKTFTLSVRHKPILFNHETKEPYPVETSSKYRTEEVFAVMNKTKEITCSALANPPPTFQWYRRRNNYDSHIIPTADTITTSEDGMSSTMLLRMLSEEDKGEYKCTASNKKGQVSVIYDVIPALAPIEPDDIEFKDANATHITFNVLCVNCTFKSEAVQSSDAENLPIEGYTFQLVPHKEGFIPDWDQGEKFDLEVGTGEENNTSLFTVGPLVNSTIFHVRVRSFNAAGHSDWVDMKELPKTTAHATRIIATFLVLVIALFLSYY